MEYLLGIDIGTSGTKTVLFDRDANPITAKTFEYPLYQEQNGWAEQEPNDWWDETGKGVLIDHDGIKEKAISDGLIKNDMIGDGEINGKLCYKFVNSYNRIFDNLIFNLHANAYKENASFLIATRYLFLRSIRKLLLRFLFV